MQRKVVLFVLCGVLALAGLASAETLEEILAKNLEVRGGKDAILAVQTTRSTGTMRMGGSAAGALEVPFTAEFKRPNKVRIEFTMQGMTAVQAYDGEVGWSIMPFLGKTEAEEMAEDQLKDIKEQADFDGVLVNYEEKGHAVELMGTEEVDGTPAYKVKVTKANGDVVNLFLEPRPTVTSSISSSTRSTTSSSRPTPSARSKAPRSRCRPSSEITRKSAVCSSPTPWR
jgi:outer membrane lipoprotein-sorting protein